MLAMYDALVIGSGPNGLAAAITLARAQKRVLLLEAHAQLGGAMQSLPLTRPNFVHDVGSSIYPMGRASPFLRSLPLHAFGLDWIDSPLVLAHPLGERSVCMHRDLDATADELGADGPMYRRLLGPLLPYWPELLDEILRPMLRLPRLQNLLPFAKFGLRALPSAAAVASLFQTAQGKALWAGIAAHSGLPLSVLGTAAPALVLNLLGHAAGWPFPRGGASALAQSMRAYFEFLGGEVRTGVQVDSLAALPPARAVVVNSSPATLLRLLGSRAPLAYRRALGRFQYGAGMQKLDYALAGPVPWQDERVAQAATVHLGGSFAEIARSERTLSGEQPYLLLAQHSLFDKSRAPAAQHTLWVYAHVPSGSSADIRPAIERQIERYAPDFRSRILHCHQTTAPMLERFTPVCVGGDVGGGAVTLPQMLARPVLSATPYRTPVRGIYLASSSTAPGGGVHGMAGYWAARAVLQDLFE